MPERISFTEKRIEDLKPTPGKQVEYFDTKDRLFGIRVSPGGRKTFFVKKRVHGRLIRVSLGEGISLLKAREAYHDALEQLRKGINPNLDKKRKTADNADKSGLLSAVFDSYLLNTRDGNLKEVSRRNYRYNFKHLDAWHNKRVEDITPAMVQERFKDITRESGTYSANRVISLLKYLMSHSMKTLNRPSTNPAIGIKFNGEYPRREAMPPEDLPAFVAALDAVKGDVGADLYKLLLFTGLRKSEAMGLKWTDIDLEKKSLGLTDTKNGKPLCIPLSGFVCSLLGGRKRKVQGSVWVFPTQSRTGHVTNTGNFDRQVLEQGVRVYPHLLRKTFTTAAVALSIPTAFVDVLTGHIPLGVTGRHYTAPNIEQLRPFTEEITAELLRQTGIQWQNP